MKGRGKVEVDAQVRARAREEEWKHPPEVEFRKKIHHGRDPTPKPRSCDRRD